MRDAPTPRDVLVGWLGTAIGLADEHEADEVTVNVHMLRECRAALIRREPLDVERLETAMAKYGIHIDVYRDRKHEVPCESCQDALAKIAAEYARLEGSSWKAPAWAR